MSSAAETVTPLVLTFNEESNIGRTLDSLQWARRVVIVDSQSTDRTAEIAKSYQNAVLYTREFDKHVNQWNFGIYETGIDTALILTLDADMHVTPELVTEIEQSFIPGNFAGGLIPFDYRYYGHRLRGSLCPPQLRLFKRDAVRVTQPDHTQHFSVDGEVYKFRARLIHDDRKPLERFVASQLAYQVLNDSELANGGRNRLRDHLRKLGVMPPIVGLIAYLKAGGPFYGAAAARYGYERAVCESLLAMRIINRKLQSKQP
ncbi:MAG TPA: glycosyltransferase family 2 protein [Pyrinomonadaceae bacterium]|nr:glycosyltransferase family 2 protein [Pyrinomonadaceae bacterium]